MPDKTNTLITSSWENIVPSIIVSLFIGVLGMLILTLGTKVSRKSHIMNIFSQ